MRSTVLRMDALNLHPDPARPRWSYEIRPHATDRCARSTAAAAGEPASIPAEPVSPTGRPADMLPANRNCPRIDRNRGKLFCTVPLQQRCVTTG